MKANQVSANKPQRRTTRRVLIGSLVAITSVLAACGSDKTESSVSVETETPTANQVNGDAPQRIVSLSPTHTEILYALGAGDQVVAVDSMSNYPAESASVLTDISAYEPNVEAISALEPDLVVIGDDFSGLAEQLSMIGIESWVSPAPMTLDEAYEQIIDLGKVVGHADEAQSLTQKMQDDISGIVDAVEISATPISYYHELDDTYYSVTGNTFIGSIYELFGMRNIADATEGDSDYPQLSAEFIVSQDPNVIFLADVNLGVTAETVAARPGWSGLSAVVSGNIVAIDDDIASRWGPRLVEYVQAVADGVSQYIASLS
ncbi:MAG: ABC transporter substrate-binding protein [Ilumatobacteraceae bacterium]|nr:ABC transporter substrate-binding protein [Ilumatobacteraceae bacterium]MDP5114542.1 ABC transporter substrate-binding protein [Ilumatobacteraceae bacterium]